MYANQLEAYKTTQKLNLSGRELEAFVLSEAALKIRECRDNWNAADRQALLKEADRKSVV